MKVNLNIVGTVAGDNIFVFQLPDNQLLQELDFTANQRVYEEAVAGPEITVPVDPHKAYLVRLRRFGVLPVESRFIPRKTQQIGIVRLPDIAKISQQHQNFRAWLAFCDEIKTKISPNLNSTIKFIFNSTLPCCSKSPNFFEGKVCSDCHGYGRKLK